MLKFVFFVYLVYKPYKHSIGRKIKKLSIQCLLFFKPFLINETLTFGAVVVGAYFTNAPDLKIW